MGDRAAIGVTEVASLGYQISASIRSIRNQIYPGPMPIPEQETNFNEIAGVELSIEKSRARTERAVKALRDHGADSHLIEALERAQSDLSDVARTLRQGTYFAVPTEQTRFEAA